MALDQYKCEYINSAVSVQISAKLDGVSVSKTVKTDAATGVATFSASQAGVAPGTVLTFVTSLTYRGESYRDTARLLITAPVSVSSAERAVPEIRPSEEAAAIAPTVILAGEFTAGANPISKSSGSVNFFRQGRRIADCELRIYDVNGNIINRVKIKDNAIATQARRKVGTWDLCDRFGRTVSEGTYLARGIITLPNGKKEKVSVILSVR
jgi:hypothetical protein